MRTARSSTLKERDLAMRAGMTPRPGRPAPRWRWRWRTPESYPPGRRGSNSHEQLQWTWESAFFLSGMHGIWFLFYYKQGDLARRKRRGMGAWKTISPGTWNISYGNCPNDPAGMTKAGLSLAPYPTFPRLALLAMQVFSIREKKRRLISDDPVVGVRDPVSFCAPIPFVLQ